MPRADTWTASLYQNVYDFLWDAFSAPIGTFRMIVALVPVVVDAGVEVWSAGLGTAMPGVCLYAVAAWLLYTPLTMLQDNRLQARGSLASLNAASHAYARRTRMLRLFCLAVLALTLVLFHRIGGFLLVNIAYARCIQVRPRQRLTSNVRLKTAWSGKVILVPQRRDPLEALPVRRHPGSNTKVRNEH